MESSLATERTGAVDAARQWVAAKAEKVAADAEKKAAETPQQMFLPGVEEFMRAMPNHIARSSLFAPVAPGRKKIHKDAVLVSRGDAEIRFWGEQLDETQADVWMQAMFEACKRPLGESVIINRARFLRSLGRQTGNYEYKWLHRTMQALAFAMLVIVVKKPGGQPKLMIGKTRTLHMIESFDCEDGGDTYTLRIDPRWRSMYGNREFALIDWDKRLQFGQHQNMAKALQRLVVCSSDRQQQFGLDWLKGKLEYSSPLRKFKDALESAGKELERLEIIAAWKIGRSTKGNEQLTVWLPE